MNAVSPGAYISLTKVDFKALDNSTIKPVGVYGSRVEIIKFLCSVGIIDDVVSVHAYRTFGDI
jgi:hypothetical protein